MRILTYGINYAPELTGIGKYTSEMVEWLVSRGHRVRVVTAPPYYPAWRINNGYASWQYKREKIGGAEVWRCPLWVPSKPSGATRLLHLFSFSLSSLPVILGMAYWSPEVVVVIAPTILCALGGLVAARLCGAVAWLHIQDFEIDAALSLQMLGEGALGDLARVTERRLLVAFDRISTISRKMAEKLSEKGVEEKKRVFFPNWVDTRLIYPMDEPSPMREYLGIPREKIVALYSGNMGEKQGLDTIIQAAISLHENNEILFIMCGNGATYCRLREQASPLKNIYWLPLQPLDKLNELLNLADIHLLPQRADAEDLVMPSKLTGMFASGKPVLATARRGSEVANLVETRGLIVPPGDTDAFVKALLRLAYDRDIRNHMGQAARLYAEKHLDREMILSNFEKELRASIDQKEGITR